MIEYRLTETDVRMALLHRGYTESQVAQLLGDIKAEAWQEGYYAADDEATHNGTHGYTENPYECTTIHADD